LAILPACCSAIPVMRREQSMMSPSTAMSNPATGSKSADLARELGLSASVAIVVGTVIGSGIFRVPSTMMVAVGSPKMVYAAWIVGGLLSFFGALTYAELGAMKPQAGGEYVYVRDAYGPLWGFLYGWTWFAVAKPASIATITSFSPARPLDSHTRSMSQFSRRS
jgi:amino acid transporter